MPTKLGEVNESEIRHKLLAHSNELGSERKMCRSVHKDHYERIGSVFYSINGSPPRGYAIYNPQSSRMSLYDSNGKRFKIYRNAVVEEVKDIIEGD